jgi:hypothetical protein
MNERLILRHSHRVPVGIWSVCVLLLWVYAGAEILDRARGRTAGHLPGSVIAWAVVGLVFLSAALWIWFGDRLVALKDDALTIDVRVFGQVIYRRIACRISELRSLRLEVYEYKFRGKVIRKKRLTAEYQGKREVLLDQLSDLQAQTVRDASIWRLAGGIEE